MVITLKYQGTCSLCGRTLPKGISAHWKRRGRKGLVKCLECQPIPESFEAEQLKAWQNRDKDAWRKMEDSYPRTCPTCHTVGALTAYEARKGYHCQACTRAAEFGAE